MRTRNLLLAILFITATTLTVNAQDLQFGVKAGFNLSNLSGDIEDTESLPGFHAGIVADFKIGEKFSIQPELLYSLEGAKFSSGAEWRLYYLNLPVMAKYHISETFSLEAGPQIGYLTNSDLSGAGSEGLEEFLEEVSFGASLGAAFIFDINILRSRYIKRVL
jgi:hypothetical protein